MTSSKFSSALSGDSGILRLMDDLGAALSSDKEVFMLGGGNPAAIPIMQERFRQRMAELLRDGAEFDHMIGDYDGPQGNTAFVEALASFFEQQFGWPIRPENIAVTNGSQSSFYVLFNLFAGTQTDGSVKKILLPLTPEYIGYADLGLGQDIFRANKPGIEQIDATTFKYHIDFDSLTIDKDIGAICVSRPTNPTGNVLTDEEIEKLQVLSAQHDIPLIIDNAYGLPFPGIIFSEATPVWNKRTILCMSLSKLGLPGVRCGMVIASQEIIEAMSAANAILSLAPGSLGPALVLDMVRNGEIIELSQQVIMPWYQQRAHQAADWLREELGDYPFSLHKPEGAIFLWLWFKNLPITVEELYKRLKQRGVLVIAGQHFYPGLKEPWQHVHECIRVTYAQDERIVKRGIEIIADEVRKTYDQTAKSA